MARFFTKKRLGPVRITNDELTIEGETLPGLVQNRVTIVELSPVDKHTGQHFHLALVGFMVETKPIDETTGDTVQVDYIPFVPGDLNDERQVVVTVSNLDNGRNGPLL
jgi:hypothetical protein